MSASPTVRRLLAEYRAMMRTGHRPDGESVGPTLAARLPRIIAGILAALKSGAANRQIRS